MGELEDLYKKDTNAAIKLVMGFFSGVFTDMTMPIK